MLNIKNSETTRKLLIYMYNYNKTNDIQIFNISELTYQIKTTWSNLFKIIEHLEKLNIIITEKLGRTRKIYLTQTGVKIAQKLDELDKLW